jgi:RNA polymerase sigma-70 factor, ECF subfamily
MSERPVASTLQAHEAERLAALFDAHAGRLYRLARRLVANADDALDLVQDTFLKAARSPHSIPHGSSGEEAWLVRVLVNVRRDQWRKETVRKGYDNDLGHPPIQHSDPERAFVVRTSVWTALDQLSPRRRAVVVMSEIEGLSTSSISRLLGISAITVRWHLARGRRELAHRLKPELGETHEQLEESLAGRRSVPSRTSVP